MDVEFQPNWTNPKLNKMPKGTKTAPNGVMAPFWDTMPTHSPKPYRPDPIGIL